MSKLEFSNLESSGSESLIGLAFSNNSLIFANSSDRFVARFSNVSNSISVSSRISLHNFSLCCILSSNSSQRSKVQHSASCTCEHEREMEEMRLAIAENEARMEKKTRTRKNYEKTSSNCTIKNSSK